MALFKKKCASELLPPPPPVLEETGILKEQEFDDSLDFSDFKLEEGIEEDIKEKVYSEDEQEIQTAIEGIKHAEKKPSFFSKLFSRKEKVKIEEPRLKMEPVPESSNMNTITNLIKSARSHLLDLRLEEARYDYVEIMKIYNRLAPDEQKNIYDDIKEIYNERKSAESLNLRD